MEKTFNFLICICVIGIIVILFFSAKNSYSNLKNDSDAVQQSYVIHKDSIRTPIFKVSSNNQRTLTVPVKTRFKFEFTATLEELKYYFLTHNFTNEDAKNIVIIGEKVADDSKDIKWTIY
jgi:hypothetical protein